jgi:hypothetical protein
MTDLVYRYLADSDKSAIIEAHIKNLEHTIYSLEVTKIEILSEDTPNLSQVSSIDSQILSTTNKIQALLNELSILETE